MLSLRILATIGAAICASGCATLREVPPPPATTSAACVSHHVRASDLRAVSDQAANIADARRNAAVDAAAQERAAAEALSAASAALREAEAARDRAAEADRARGAQVVQRQAEAFATAQQALAAARAHTVRANEQRAVAGQAANVALAAWTEASRDANADAPQHRVLCNVIANIAAQSTQYRTHYNSVSDTRAAVQGLTIAAAVAGAGFVTFDAHNDNVKAAGLLTGAGTLVNNGLSLNSRVDILRDGVAALNCYASIGNTFADAYILPLHADDGTSISEGLDSVIADLGNALVSARMTLALPAPRANSGRTVDEVRGGSEEEFAAVRARLATAITGGEASYDKLLQARRAMHRAPEGLDAGWREADTLIAGRLVGIRPDLAAIIQQAQALSTSLRGEEVETPAPSKEETPAPAGDESQSRIERLLAAINLIGRHVDEANRIDAEHYITAYERLATCKAIAAT